MKIQFLIFALFYLTFLSAQITVKGVVKDDKGNPLEMANVIAMNISEGTLEGYSITDAKGNYKIKISKLGDINLKTSYLGFDSQNKILVIGDKETIKNFVLTESKNNLDAVEITYEMPVTIKGDTIVYNADSFTSGKEKKLGDVLKKLPGVEVNAAGEIEIEGKKVSRIMVEGKDFFDGDTKLATKNIPADAVKKIEVLKNYNEVSQMRGVGDDSDNIAINIKLKEGKKNFWFGEVTAGIGNGGKDTRYLAHPKLFYYSPKKSVNIITDFNNIGSVPFTFQDYFKFSGGFKNLMKRGGGINISSNNLGFSFLKNNKAQEIKTKFTALNFSQEVNNKLNISGFAIFSDTDTKMKTNILSTLTQLTKDPITNIITTENIVKNTANQTKQANTLGLLKLSAAYKPSSIFQLDYDVILKKSTLAQSNSIASFSTVTTENNIKSKNEGKPFSINQNTNIYYTLNAKNIFAFAGQFLYEKNNPLYNSLATDRSFYPILPTINTTNVALSQDKKVTTNKLDATLDYYYILNNKSNLNFTLGSTFSKQSLTSSFFETLNDGSINNFTEVNLNNAVNYNFTDVFLGLHYKLKTGKFLLIPGITAHKYTSKNKQLNTTIKKSPTYLLPDLSVKFNIKNSETLNFKYGITTSFTDINKLALGYLYSSYNMLALGNNNLTNTLFHDYSLHYSNFNTFSYTNIFANISYKKKYDVIKNTSQLIGINAINTSVNTTEPEDTFNSMARISKRFGKFKVKLSGNYNIRNSVRLTTLPTTTIVTNKTKYITQGYKTSVSTNFKTFPNFEIGFETSLADFDSNKTQTDKPYANIEVGFLKDFILIADYKFNNFKNKENGITNTYDFLNTALYYQKENSSWEFKLEAINLLNAKSIHQDTFSVFSRSTSKYIVQPRYVMFSVKYDL